MKLTDFSALTFDCYGTLIDWETGIAAALRPWTARNGLETDDAALLAAFSRHEHARQSGDPFDPVEDRGVAGGRGQGGERFCGEAVVRGGRVVIQVLGPGDQPLGIMAGGEHPAVGDRRWRLRGRAWILGSDPALSVRPSPRRTGDGEDPRRSVP